MIDGHVVVLAVTPGEEHRVHENRETLREIGIAGKLFVGGTALCTYLTDWSWVERKDTRPISVYVLIYRCVQ